MASPADPYRTLGLGRDATIEQVKRAYRRLAKANHPDTAGETAVPRFLAIKAAYEAIAGPGATDETRGRGRPSPPQRPWDADPARADATKRAYGARNRGPRPGARAPRGPRPEEPSPPPDGAENPQRASNLATPGSTSYDGTEGQPFEPDWGGASWYGTTSGTYWTLNPKEYADPRKHGAEYQARARRARREVVDPVPPASVGAADPRAVGEEPIPPTETPTHTTESWWEATAGAAPDEASADVNAEAAANAAASAASTDANDGPSAAAVRDRWLRPRRFGLLERVGIALLAWVPLAAGIGALAGSIDGCGASAAGCTAIDLPFVSIVDVAMLAILLIVPLVARITAVGSVAVAVVAVAGSLVIPEVADRGTPGPIPVGFAMALVGAWLLGVTLSVVREVRRAPGPVS